MNKVLEMEIGNFVHMGADLVSQILMIYSSSPLARQLCAQLETGDPFNIDVKLDMDSKNRNAEILNVYLKTKGLKITFKKHLKKPIKAAHINPMAFFDPNPTPQPKKIPMIFYGEGEKFNEEEAIAQLKESRDNNKKHVLEIHPMEFFDEIHLEKDDEKKSKEGD